MRNPALGALGALTLLAAAGCAAHAGQDPRTGPRFQIVAGGGAVAGDGPAGRVRIDGTLRDIHVSEDDVIRILVDDDGPVIWCIGGDKADRLEPDRDLGSHAKLTATGDGTIYVTDDGKVWRVDADGHTTRAKRGLPKDARDVKDVTAPVPPAGEAGEAVTTPYGPATYAHPPVLHEGRSFAALHDHEQGILIAAVDGP